MCVRTYLHHHIMIDLIPSNCIMDWFYTYLLLIQRKSLRCLEIKIYNCFGELQKGPLDSGTLIGRREKDLVILHDIFVIYMRSRMSEVFLRNESIRYVL